MMLKTNKLTAGRKWMFLTDILINTMFNVSEVYYKINISDVRVFPTIIEVYKLSPK